MSDTTNLRTIRGTITRLFHQAPGFCAGKLLAVKSDVVSSGEITFAGKVYVREGEAVALRGSWVDHPTYGRQWKVIERIHEDATVTEESLAAWLTMHGRGLGIGQKRAEKIAAEFGSNFSGWLKDDPERIAIEAGVSLESIHEIARLWETQENKTAVFMALAKYELTSHQFETLYERFKGSIVALLEENPYLLIREVHGLGFKKVDEIARKVGVPLTHPGRIEAAITFAITKEEEDGSTCVERGRLIESTEELLGVDPTSGITTTELIDLIDARLAYLVQSSRVRQEKESGRAAVWCASPWIYRHEERVAAFLRDAATPNPHFTPDMAVDLAESKPCERLDESQRRAAAMAFRNRACLISGGAGAGKSVLVAAIANVYRAADLDVALAAPTGKAARRLEEVAPGFTASTIHRLLGYSPVDGFRYRDGNYLPVDVVILDEVSMLDSELASFLFDAIGPKTAVVLVGDHHQLPPVGPGALLRDAISRELLPLSVLNQCHRHAGPLKENCQAVLRGEVLPTVAWDEEEEGKPGPWYVARQLHTTDALARYVERLFADVLTAKLKYDPVRDVQFLTPIHSGPIGTRALNILLQRLHQATLGVTTEPVAPDTRPRLYTGDKVIYVKNNYKLDVMNGHQGRIVNVGPLVVQFDDRVVEIPKDCVGEVDLAYAMTPHKAQGSEFPCVVVVCHKAHRFMTHRNWLYTATTRAKTTCVILGEPEGIEHAARRIVNNQRRTLLPLLHAVAAGGTGADSHDEAD